MKHILLFSFFILAIGTSWTQIVLSVQTTPSTCQNNGSITVTATGGSGSYTYTCNVSQSSNVFNGMAAGTYTVQVSDGIGNSNTITAVVGGNYQNPVIASATSPSNGNITVTLQAGTGTTAPFQYAYALAGAPLNPTTYQSSNVFTCLAAGNYDVYVLDACNNTTVYHNLAVSMPAFDFNMSCDNSPPGNVNNIVVSGYTTNGNGTYNYSWSSGLTGTLSTSPATTTLGFTPTCSTTTITVTNVCQQSQNG